MVASLFRRQIAAELATAEEHERPLGRRQLGFEDLALAFLRHFEVSGTRGYLYDASTFPISWSLGEGLLLQNCKLSPNERYQRQKLYGELREGLRHPTLSLETGSWEYS
jgi:hypothetical protein